MTSTGAERLPARGRVRAAARLVLTEPLRRRTGIELGYWLLSSLTGLLGFAAITAMLAPGVLLTATLAGALAGLTLLAAAVRTSRAILTRQRALAAGRLGVVLPGPVPFRRGRGPLGRLDARLRDGTGWGGALYLAARLPLTLIGVYLVLGPWLAGLFYLSYPMWWLMLDRDHSPIGTPLPAGGVIVTSLGESLAICLGGLVLLLIAPWTTRLLVLADVWLMRALLSGQGRAERIRALETSRASAVDDSAATLRRVERDLHDGAQARLVALAMHLGRARDQLGDWGEPPDADRARELLAAARDDARAALAELRDLARGIHPPALDAGLADALAGLAAASATPATLSTEIRVRPTPAIETIAYFCAAELLTNVSKHSRATRASVRITEKPAGRAATLVLTVTDDGDGGAAVRPGGGLAGLTQRVQTVDGSLALASPPGGPTVVTVELPLRA